METVDQQSTDLEKNLYEGMFLVDSAEAAADWDGVNQAILTVLERSDAEIVSIRKWDECKLAYDINGKGRGTYILCYFRALGGRISVIERDAQLSQQIMRVLILNAEHMTAEDIEQDTPAVKAEKRSQEIIVAREAREVEQAAAKAEAADVVEEAAVAVEAEVVVEDAVEPEVIAEEATLPGAAEADVASEDIEPEPTIEL